MPQWRREKQQKDVSLYANKIVQMATHASVYLSIAIATKEEICWLEEERDTLRYNDSHVKMCCFQLFLFQLMQV